MILGTHHIGLVVEDYEETIAFYCDVLGATVIETGNIDELIDIIFLKLPDNRIEVIGRHSRGTYLDELLDELLKVSPYHVAYVVDDIRETIAMFKEAGYKMFNQEPVEGLGSYVRAFVVPDVVLGPPIEIVEMCEN